MSTLRDFGLIHFLAAPFIAIWHLLVGRRRFCEWPGCWHRADVACSGIMFGRPDDFYCTSHCGKWHRNPRLIHLGAVPDCPRPTLRAVLAVSDAKERR